RSIVVVVATCVALLLALGIKVLTQTRLTFHYRFLKRLGLVFKHALLQAVDFNFVRYGLSMPQVLWRILRQYPDFEFSRWERRSAPAFLYIYVTWLAGRRVRQRKRTDGPGWLRRARSFTPLPTFRFQRMSCFTFRP